jgi:hypothetical protein
MSDEIRLLLRTAADTGSPIQPPGDLGARAVRRLRRRRAGAVIGSVTALLAVVLGSSILLPTGGGPERAAEPSMDAVVDGELMRTVELDGGRLALNPYEGKDPAWPREAAEAAFRSAETIFWANTPATNVQYRLALAEATVDEPGASLTDAPAWVALYRYDPVAFGCPMRTAPASALALPPDAFWHAFVLPLNGEPAFLWHGRGTGACGPLADPRIEPARQHLSARWTERARDGATVTLAIEIPCQATIDEIRGPDPSTGEIQVTVSAALSAVPVRCAAPAPATRQVQLPKSDLTLAHADEGLLGS